MKPQPMNTQPNPLSFPPQLGAAVQRHPYPLVFATISGAHLYGFASADSDWDLRGSHILPLPDVLGLKAGQETHELDQNDGEVELDLVTHDIHKFARLLLTRNGYVLEQVLSPLIVHTTPEHAELRDLARQCVTRHHIYHYLGFTNNQWAMLEKEAAQPGGPRLKPLLYAFRTVLTGIHMMRSGEIEANLETLALTVNEAARLPFLAELIGLKREGREKERLPEPLSSYETDYRRLVQALEATKETTVLPAAVPDKVEAAVNDWLIGTRLNVGGTEVQG
ncbi:DNA polymerase beta superfamily protein [Deinococcus sp.]|uniref:nucleotidyltransferase domain-containing protein n=1 Tax=Deinococcus sp. TaxID=47478 RepID=UPI003B596C72